MNPDMEIATPPDAADAYILCDVAGTAYAVDSREVEQLEMVGALTPVPNSPPFVEGVTARSSPS
jgi:chemotaxis signal transduction protein